MIRYLKSIAIICVTMVLCAAPSLTCVFAEDPVFHEDTAGAAAELREAMKNRESSVTVGVIQDVDKDSLKKMIGSLIKEAVKHTGVPDEGDYINYQYSGFNGSAKTERVKGKPGVVLSYKMEYYDSADQEKELDAKVDEVIKSLDLDGKSDYEKLIAVHDWLCDNVEYDSSDGKDLSRTAYDAIVNGKAVCQGYSNALYRLLLEAGVDNRIIFGDGVDNGVTMPHTWNIVDLYGDYYNVDVTWDDSTRSRDYFVQPAGEFDKSHVAGDEYAKNFFTEEYPVAKEDFSFDIGKPKAAVISCAKKMAAGLR